MYKNLCTWSRAGRYVARAGERARGEQAVKDVFYLERLDQAEALLRPGRIEILRELASPASCTDVGARLGQAPQKIYYHVKRMEQAGLVDRVAERQVRGITEGIYQASGSSYWLAPALVGAIGQRRAQDEMSLGFLLSLSEQMQSDLARLARETGERPSLGMSGEVRAPAAAAAGVPRRPARRDREPAYPVRRGRRPCRSASHSPATPRRTDHNGHRDLHPAGIHRRPARSRLRCPDRRGSPGGLAGRARRGSHGPAGYSRSGAASRPGANAGGSGCWGLPTAGGSGFSWTLEGAETDVDITLDPRDDGATPLTQLTLVHSNVAPRASGDSWWVRDLLMLSLANLASYCEGRGIGPRCDFTAFGATEARASVEIAASPSQVFASLIEPAQLNRWIAEHAEVEPEVGGRYDFGWDHGPVKILGARARQGSGLLLAAQLGGRRGAGLHGGPLGARGARRGTPT